PLTCTLPDKISSTNLHVSQESASAAALSEALPLGIRVGNGLRLPQQWNLDSVPPGHPPGHQRFAAWGHPPEAADSCSASAGGGRNSRDLSIPHPVGCDRNFARHRI